MADSSKKSKKDSRYNVLYNKVRELCNVLLDDEFVVDIINTDRKLNNNGIEYITKSLIDILNQSIITNNSNPIVNEDKYGITKKQQLEKAEEYFRSILQKINVDDKGWDEFLSSISILLTIKDSPHSPHSLKIDENLIHPNILTNAAWYVANNIQPKDAKIYINNIDDNNDKQFGPMRAVSVVKKEYEELSEQRENKQQEKIKNIESEIGVQGEQIMKGQKIINRLMDENSKLREENTQQEELIGKLKITRREMNDVKSDIHKLSTKNQLDILNGVALTYAADPKLKQHIGDVRKALKSDPKLELEDNQINYIITKALSENDRYLKTIAANPDLFDRDMSQDTIQKENEQFQSKLRQQNLRYILPAFIERRDKLVENTLNPNLLKGAFAI